MRKLIVLAHATFLNLLWALPATASDTTAVTLPWNEPLERLQQNLSGPTARTLLLIGLTVGAILWAGTDNNRGLQWIGKVLVALAVVANLVSLLGLLGLDGAVL